jgi:SAM-dependent methyltransferase
MSDKPVALDAYEKLAARYAALIDTKPHNAYYERPATLSLLPDVAGWRGLDAGCGPGAYTEWLLDHGAEVVGMDVSPAMIAHARQRVGDRAELHVADLAQPLDFLPDSAFDLVFSALTLHYVRDWSGMLAEFARVLRPAGLLVFSVEHPFSDLIDLGSGDYFATELVGMPWRGFGGEPVYVPFYRRSLTTISEALWNAGFVIERLIEPQPTAELRRAEPEDAVALMRQPGFLCVRARLDRITG